MMPTETSSGEVVEQFARAYDEYVRALQGITMRKDVEQRAVDAYEEYVDALRGLAVPPDVQQRVLDAYGDYMRKLADASTSPEGLRLAAEAYLGFVRTAQEPSSGDGGRHGPPRSACRLSPRRGPPGSRSASRAPGSSRTPRPSQRAEA